MTHENSTNPINSIDTRGKKVHKISKRPFKSGNKVNTIKGVIINPDTDRPAFVFEEDDSCVDCFICAIEK